jgi:hypothetical protein
MRSSTAFPLALRAVTEFQDTLRAARHLALESHISDELDARMQRARELLDVLDEALLWLDPKVHRRVFEAVPPLRAGLNELVAEIRGGSIN